MGRGIGIDPSAHPERLTGAAAAKIEWITDFYSEAYAHLQADAVVCRHTLEHIAPVGDFMRMIRSSIGDRTDTIVLFELPDVRRVLEEVAFWDVYYEHCSYFSAGSLARLFRSSGFDVLDVALDYDDQYLLVEARPSATVPAQGAPFQIEDDMAVLSEAVTGFDTAYRAILDRWSSKVTDVVRADGNVVIWGAGSKGVAFLTALDIHDEIRFAVDINPHKHGMFMAGTGQEIVSPQHLVAYDPDLVVVMNPVYLDEIRAEIQELGIRPEVVAV
ncbi:MAG: class I SAM-dependent methyltransferase [Microthrixaceae bacterium]|nr:class I SAM-dependent methyltransferase [Microthrixaceae bacterium]